MIDQLKSIGIEKGKPFDPDAQTQAILERRGARGARLARRRIRDDVLPALQPRAPLGAARLARSWSKAMQTDFAEPDAYPVDARGVAYSCAFFSAKHLGAGQYLPDDDQRQGRPAARRRQTYRLHVPANAPVRQYWSATAYDRATHALIRNAAALEPRLADAGPAEERGRLGGHLFRRRRRPAGQGVELGSDQARTERSRCCSASTARRSRCSTRRGCCRTSRR